MKEQFALFHQTGKANCFLIVWICRYLQSTRIFVTAQVRPLIMVDVIIEQKSATKIEYFVKAKSNFKAKSTANNVDILIPVPCDAQNPTFKTASGSVGYVPDRDAMMWSVKEFAGQKELLMKASFNLPTVVSRNLQVIRAYVSLADRENYRKQSISLIFEIPYLTISGIQVRNAHVLLKLL
jgi:AP-1 complex subunit mu